MYIFQPDRYLLKQQVKKFSDHIGGKTLDLGAGSFERYRSFFNCDEYIKMDAVESENIDIIGSVDNIPLPDESIDSIVCTQVFEHLKDPFKSAEEIYRVLKKGGKCLISIPQTNELHEEPYDYFRYTKYGIKEIFEKKGFILLEEEQRGAFFTMIAQMKIRYYIDRFALFERKYIGRIASRLFSVYSRFMMWRDKKDKSKANKKHTLGWIFVFEK